MVWVVVCVVVRWFVVYDKWVQLLTWSAAKCLMVGWLLGNLVSAGLVHSPGTCILLSSPLIEEALKSITTQT